MGRGGEGDGDGDASQKDRDTGKAPTPESQPSSSPVLEDKAGEGGGDKRNDEEDDDDNEAEEDEEDEELAALLQENSEESSSSSSSSSEDESGTETGQKPKLKNTKKGKEKDDTGDKKQKGKKKNKGRHVYESPASTLAVLITACWTLRIPVLARDFIRRVFSLYFSGHYLRQLRRLIESYDLPYLDPIARRLVPESMITHLTKHNIQALSPYVRPATTPRPVAQPNSTLDSTPRPQ